MYFVGVDECEQRKYFRLSGGRHNYSGGWMCKKSVFRRYVTEDMWLDECQVAKSEGQLQIKQLRFALN